MSSSRAFLRMLFGCGLFVLAPMQLASQVGRRPKPERRQIQVIAAPNPQPGSEEADGTKGWLERPAELASFFEQLHRVATSSDAPAAHILHFGDSHTSSDLWTARLRRLFQDRFGEGGSGFSVAGHPFPGYRRFDAPGGRSGAWRAVGVHAGEGDGYLGLGGIGLLSERAGASVYLQADCDILEIHYLQQPNGGRLALYEDGKLREEFSTAGERRPGIKVFKSSPGTHRFVLKTASADPIRLFGWVADKARGVTYESLGLLGARAPAILHWDEEMLETYLNARNPALIVLAYGTNEAVDLQLGIQRYRQMLSTLLRRLRRIAPDVPILVVGPPDIHPEAEVERVALAQREASRENGCAFWDMREHMGGPGSMRNWTTAGLAETDYIHFSPAGYRRLGDALFTDLMQHYDTYKHVRTQILANSSNE